jgi:hypothetical protein
MKYSASRGGHAPGHIREALENALIEGEIDSWEQRVEIEWWNPAQESWWKTLSQNQRAQWVLGQLWNCTDCLPGAIHDLFRSEHDVRVGSYAALARHLKGSLN